MNFIFYLIIGLFAEIATKHGGHCEPSTLLGGSEMDATHARQWAPSSVHPENLRGKIIINTIKPLNTSTELKIRRLKALRMETRNLANEIRAEMKRKNIALNRKDSDSKRRRKHRCRAHIRRRIKAMMERLAKLERQLRMQRKNMRKLCTMNQLGRSKFKFPKNAKGQNRTRTRGHRGRKKNHPAAAKKDPSATADLSSSNGSSSVKEACQRHTDCKPGFCCHRASFYLKGNCIQYSAKEGEGCKHSCACEPPLQCQPADEKASESSPSTKCRRSPPSKEEMQWRNTTTFTSSSSSLKNHHYSTAAAVMAISSADAESN